MTPPSPPRTPSHLTRSYRAYVLDLGQADVARRGDMLATAQLQTVDRLVIAAGAPHRDDAHFIAVFLAEQRHRAFGDRLVGGHQPRLDSVVLADICVDVARSEERRVGQECVRTCRSRWAPNH